MSTALFHGAVTITANYWAEWGGAADACFKDCYKHLTQAGRFLYRFWTLFTSNCRCASCDLKHLERTVFLCGDCRKCSVREHFRTRRETPAIQLSRSTVQHFESSMSPAHQRLPSQTPWLLVLVSMTTKLNYKLTHLSQAWWRKSNMPPTPPKNPSLQNRNTKLRTKIISSSQNEHLIQTILSGHWIGMSVWKKIRWGIQEDFCISRQTLGEGGGVQMMDGHVATVKDSRVHS